MSPDWYSMVSLPEGRVIVRVWWIAFGLPRLFTVARIWHPRTRSWSWVRLIKGDDGEEFGDLVPVPPKGRDRAGWHPEPTYWQPFDADKWIWPSEAPKPLAAHLVPQLTTTDYLMREVDDAEWAEASREADRDREDARYRRSEEDSLKARWWTDINNIKYEPKGDVTARMAEGRVLRALAWCGAGRGLTIKSMSLGSLLARMADAASIDAQTVKADNYALSLQYPPFRPLPRDHDDLPVAMAWVAALNPPENWTDARRAPERSWDINRTQRVMLRRTLTIPLTWEHIGDLEGNPDKRISGISATRCRQIYAKGMEACWRVANGESAYPGRKVVDQIEALRERNREHKRAGA